MSANITSQLITRAEAFERSPAFPEGLFSVHAGIPVETALERAIGLLIAVREHMEGLIVQDASAGPDRLAGMAAQLDQAQALVSACMFADKRAKEDQPAA